MHAEYDSWIGQRSGMLRQFALPAGVGRLRL
jgi:hypothetical protein